MVYYCCNYKLCISSSLSLSLSSIFFVSVCVCGFWFGRERERERRKEGSEKRREKCDKIPSFSCPPRLYCKMKKEAMGWYCHVAPWYWSISTSFLFDLYYEKWKIVTLKPTRLRGKKYDGFIWLQINLVMFDMWLQTIVFSIKHWKLFFLKKQCIW